jgi:hypothetical protein
MPRSFGRLVLSCTAISSRKKRDLSSNTCAGIHLELPRGVLLHQEVAEERRRSGFGRNTCAIATNTGEYGSPARSA